MVVVTFEAGAVARAYADDTMLQWPLLVDETREVYRAYDMLEASFWDLWGPRTWWAYAKLIFSGTRMRRFGSDIEQRGGDVLVAPDGRVQLVHVGQGPADRPSVEQLLAEVGQGKTA